MRFVKSKYFPYVVIISFIAFAYWSFGPMKTIEEKLVNASGSTEMLDLHPGSTVKYVYTYLDQLGDPGLAVLLEMYYFYDLIYPITYGLFFGSLILFLITRVYPKNKRVIWFITPVIFMVIFDYFENFSICYLIHHIEKIQPISFYIGAFTSIKWLTGLTAIFLVLYLISVIVIRKLKKKGSNP